MMVRTISSPSPMRGAAKEEATRLIASVADLVKMISSTAFGIEEAADCFAAALIGLGGAVGERVQAAMHVGIFVRDRRASMRSSTACGFCAEAPLSR